MLDREVGPPVFGIIKGQVPLAEGAASGILPAQPDRRAFRDQRTEGQRFAKSPVDRAALGEDLATTLDETPQLGVQVEILGKTGEAADDTLDDRSIHRGARAQAANLPLGHRAQLLQLVLFRVLLYRIEGAGEPLGRSPAEALNLLVSRDALPHQAL